MAGIEKNCKVTAYFSDVMHGSSFEYDGAVWEKYSTLGAKRVRDLSDDARPTAPSEKPIVEKAVFIKAVDWGTNYGQEESDYPASMPLVVGSLIGFLMDENEERLVIAQQVFGDGGLRSLLSIPKLCIVERYDLGVKE